MNLKDELNLLQKSQKSLQPWRLDRVSIKVSLATTGDLSLETFFCGVKIKTVEVEEEGWSLHDFVLNEFYRIVDEGEL